jgi:hypothetical protein
MMFAEADERSRCIIKGEGKANSIIVPLHISSTSVLPDIADADF